MLYLSSLCVSTYALVNGTLFTQLPVVDVRLYKGGAAKFFPLVFTWGSNQLNHWVNSSVTWEPWLSQAWTCGKRLVMPNSWKVEFFLLAVTRSSHLLIWWWSNVMIFKSIRRPSWCVFHVCIQVTILSNAKLSFDLLIDPKSDPSVSKIVQQLGFVVQ